MYSPALKVPGYKHQQTVLPATLYLFDKAQLVLPIFMLKEHVESDNVRATPLDHNSNQIPGITIPIAGHDQNIENNVGADPELTGINYIEGEGYNDDNFDDFIS